MRTIKITSNLLFEYLYKRQIYQIAESNRMEKIDSVARIESNQNFFLPELECSSPPTMDHGGS